MVISKIALDFLTNFLYDSSKKIPRYIFNTSSKIYDNVIEELSNKNYKLNGIQIDIFFNQENVETAIKKYLKNPEKLDCSKILIHEFFELFNEEDFSHEDADLILNTFFEILDAEIEKDPEFIIYFDHYLAKQIHQTVEKMDQKIEETSQNVQELPFKINELLTNQNEKNQYERYKWQFPGLMFFTKDNLEDAKSSFQSGYLKNKTYGTFDTPYSVINNDLVLDIRTKIYEEHFFLIHGNSGRGKTFFVFKFIQSITDLYDTIIYYSPQYRSEKDFNLEHLFDSIEKILFSGERILFVVDDFHLLNDQSKYTLLDRELRKNNKLSVLIISRHREDRYIPPKYHQNKYFQNFNEVAEGLFEQILQKFRQKHKLVSSQQIENEIRNETDGGNLVFLTLLLQSWSDLLSKKKDISFEEIRLHAYLTFCNFYEHNHLENWKYINHIVSALFQYEIKIDKNYLIPECNKNLAERGLQEYLQDRMIHNKMVPEEENRLFYVFMDFDRGEEKDMMKHASEFRFYLEAYGNNLVFRENRNLDRIKFTQYVIKDYIQFKPCNIQEVFVNIQSNTEEKECKILLESLYQDHKCESIINQDFLDLSRLGR